MEKVRLGLRENRQQFILLVIINAFVGGMVGLERTILPEIAGAEFHVAAKTAILSFIIVFGIVKALTNYFTGALADKAGRKNLLVAGWLIGIPVPFILMLAGSWNWIIGANVLLGISQGLTWSSTVMMKIDLVGEKDRGLAMGLNEFSGYIALAVVAFLTGWIAGNYGIRPYPFYIGIVLAGSGLLLSLFFLRDTRGHAEKEAKDNRLPRLRNIFWDTTLFDRNLGSVTQAGLINNLNDGMVWGLYPILLAQKGLDLADIGMVTAVYPAVWGVGQLFTGKMSDFFCKKSMLFWGMLIQGTAILGFVFAGTFPAYLILSAVLGWGTAMVYPTFLATVAENTHPHDRAKSLGVFRLWRDLGYAIGAVITGVLADFVGINAPVIAIGGLTVLSALVIQGRMKCRSNSVRIADWVFSKLKGEGRSRSDHNPCTTSEL
ncbi:MAG: MFS transporter [Bacteroidota bacterium]